MSDMSGRGLCVSAVISPASLSVAPLSPLFFHFSRHARLKHVIYVRLRDAARQDTSCMLHVHVHVMCEISRGPAPACRLPRHATHHTPAASAGRASDHHRPATAHSGGTHTHRPQPGRAPPETELRLSRADASPRCCDRSTPHCTLPRRGACGEKRRELRERETGPE